MAMRGRIDRIEIENFKSYRGKQVIGPFTDFTAIIGPNGSGKSNMMDAIAFVLGISSRHLRGTGRLESLVYSSSEMGEGSASSVGASPAARGSGGARVTLVFVQGDEELHLARSITSSGASKYRVGNKAVSKEKYESTLADLGLITRARNFLIAQGEVESLASKDPRGLCQLIEKVSGSDAFAAEYEDLRKQKDAAEQATKYTFQEKRRITAEKKQMTAQRDEATRYDAKKREYERLRVEYFLVQLKSLQRECLAKEAAARALKEELAVGATPLAAAAQQIAAAKRARAGLHRKRQQGLKKYEKQRIAIGATKPAMSKLKKQIAHAEKRAKEKAAAAAKITRDLAQHERQLEELGDSIEAVEEEQGAEEERESVLAAKSDDLAVSAAQLAALEALKAEAQTKALELQSKADAEEGALSKMKEQHAAASEQNDDLLRRKGGFLIF